MHRFSCVGGCLLVVGWLAMTAEPSVGQAPTKPRPPVVLTPEALRIHHAFHFNAWRFCHIREPNQDVLA